MAMMMGMTNAPSGTIIPGPISDLPHGVSTVSRNSQLNLRSLSQRARGIHGSIVRPHCLARNGQPESGATGLVGDVRLPDLVQTRRRDSFAGVGDGYAHRSAAAQTHLVRLDRDVAACRGCVDGIQ